MADFLTKAQRATRFILLSHDCTADYEKLPTLNRQSKQLQHRLPGTHVNGCWFCGTEPPKFHCSSSSMQRIYLKQIDTD